MWDRGHTRLCWSRQNHHAVHCFERHAGTGQEGDRGIVNQSGYKQHLHSIWRNGKEDNNACWSLMKKFHTVEPMHFKTIQSGSFGSIPVSSSYPNIPN